MSPRWSNLIIAGLAGLVTYLVALPLGLLIIGGFTSGMPGDFTSLTFAHYARSYGSLSVLELFYSSFIFAAGSVLLALPISIAFAWAIERTNTPLRNLAYALVIAPVAMPGMLLSMSWVLLLSPNMGVINKILMAIFGFEEAPLNIYSMGGMIFTEGLRLVPTTFLLLVGAFRAMDPALEEAAVVSGANRLVTTRLITLRVLMPSVLTAAIYIFMTAIESFEIPGVLGLRNGILVFSSRIYYATTSSYAGIPRYGDASALSTTYLFISVLLIYSYQRATRHSESYVTVTGRGYRPKLIDLGIWKYVVLLFFLTYFCLAVLLPILIMFWASLIPYYQAPSVEALSVASFSGYRDLLEDVEVRKALRNTALLMVESAAVTTLIAAIIAWVVARSKWFGCRLLDILTFLPHAIPSVVFALALMYVYLTFNFIPIYGTTTIILVAFVTKYLPFSTRSIGASIIQIHKELEEAAQVSGASLLTVLRKIILPLLLPAMAGVALWVAVHAMRELSMPLMLNSTSNNVISFLIWAHWEGGDLRHASALGVLLIAVMLIMTFSGRHLATRRMRVE
ncbi:MAG: iron ABC transporter permease [Deltaproteobacteria bacterium]|nr:iron ABC transporter permease [Deltaproteobacteria bacterium]